MKNYKFLYIFFALLCLCFLSFWFGKKTGYEYGLIDGVRLGVYTSVLVVKKHFDIHEANLMAWRILKGECKFIDKNTLDIICDEEEKNEKLTK